MTYPPTNFLHFIHAHILDEQLMLNYFILDFCCMNPHILVPFDVFSMCVDSIECSKDKKKKGVSRPSAGIAYILNLLLASNSFRVYSHTALFGLPLWPSGTSERTCYVLVALAICGQTLNSQQLNE